MKMQRKLTLLILIGLMLFQSTSFAESGIKFKEDQLITDIEILSVKSDYYVLDAKPGVFSIGDPFESFANIIFGIHKYFVRLVSIVMINAFTLNFYAMFADELVAFLHPLKTVIFDSWLHLVLGITLLYFLVQAGNGKTTSMVSEMIKLSLVLMFALVFLAYPAEFITKGKEVSSVVANELITEAFIKDRPLSIQDGVAVLNNEIWEAQVDKPWGVLNFRDKSEDYHDAFLTLEPDSKEREKATKNLRSEVPIKSYSWVLTTIIVSVTALPELLIYLALAGVAVASEPLLLFVIFSSVFVFLMALLPRFGASIIIKWIEKLVLVLSIRVIAISCLTFFLLLNEIIYDGFSPNEMIDIIALSFIKAVIFVVIYIFRKTIFRIFTFGRRGVKNVQREFNKNISPSKQFENDVRDTTKFFSNTNKNIGAVKSFVSRSGNDEDVEKNTVKEDVNQEETSKEEKPGKTSSYEKWFETAKERASNYQDKKRDLKTKDDIESEYLRQNYFYETEEAETAASQEYARTGEEQKPQYNDFVKQTKFNYENGREPFTKGERMRVIKQMNNLEQMGEDPMKIFDKFKRPEDKTTSDDFNDYDSSDESRNSDEDNKSNKKSMDEYIIRQEMKQNMDFIQNITNNNTTREIAKAYLQNQYLNHKLDAHVAARMKAKESGKSEAPEYDPFVVKVNERIKKNHNAFSTAEISRAEEKIVEMKGYGFDPVEHIKTMTSEDVSSIMKDEEKEKTYNVKDVAPQNVDFKDLEDVLKQMDERIDGKLEKAIEANKIDYKQIKEIMENDIREAKSIEEIRDDVCKLHKDMNQPFDERKVEQLAKRVAENQDFEAIAEYVDSLEDRGKDESKSEAEDS